jgi:DNA-binding transcriptional MerR regulator
MQTLVTIGQFSRLSHLTVTTLRHYHEVGLLTPARIDASGYRRYGVDQVQQAQLVRRLRQLDMPVPDVAAVLAAPTERARDTAIAEHLRKMEETLGRTTQVVASLRLLLQTQDKPVDVEYRTIPAMTVLNISAQVSRTDVGNWCAAVFPELYMALAGAGVDPAGPGGATYDQQFFECDLGEVVAFVPLVSPVDTTGRVESGTLAAGRFAVAVHSGGFDEVDRTYGRLGSHVAEHDIALDLPIREHYLIGPNHTPDAQLWRTEVWWPINPTAASHQPTQPTISKEK